MNTPNSPIRDRDYDTLLAEAMPARIFRKTYPAMHSSDGALWGELKDRERNGLADAGAVIEKRLPGRVKPQLLIHPPSYFSWLRQHSTVRWGEVPK